MSGNRSENVGSHRIRHSQWERERAWGVNGSEPLDHLVSRSLTGFRGQRAGLERRWGSVPLGLDSGLQLPRSSPREDEPDLYLVPGVRSELLAVRWPERDRLLLGLRAGL